MVASGNNRPGCHWNSFSRSKKRVFSCFTGSSKAAVLKLNGPRPTPTASKTQVVSDVNGISIFGLKCQVVEDSGIDVGKRKMTQQVLPGSACSPHRVSADFATEECSRLTVFSAAFRFSQHYDRNLVSALAAKSCCGSPPALVTYFRCEPGL